MARAAKRSGDFGEKWTRGAARDLPAFSRCIFFPEPPSRIELETYGLRSGAA